MRNNHKTFDDRYCTTKFARARPPYSVFLLPWVSLSLIINKAAIIQKFSLGYDIIALLTPT